MAKQEQFIDKTVKMKEHEHVNRGIGVKKRRNMCIFCFGELGVGCIRNEWVG